MSDAQPIAVDVSALIDADWPEWQSALEDIRREYGDEGVRALLRRLQEYSIDQGVTISDAFQWTLSGGAHPVALHLAPPGAIGGTSCPPVEGDNHG